ncbi:MAG: restriction endonuclease subunit R, partial [Candidatus Edwardsbacteria bacterium]|nr:restriction endonuclease subunit R [Candidatus Edwardsbacteria bacterium]
NRFIQIDFSATPYDVTGSGQKRTKHYFPHIIVDFDLKTAIQKGLVKTIAIDKRKEIATLELDYRSVREGNKVVKLSDGQKLMLRAGLTKLQILEKEFTGFTRDDQGRSEKHPKMLVVCEDTNVSPLVVEFLVSSEGLNEDDVLQIDSGKKEMLTDKDWEGLRQRLFNIDKHDKPKMIVSVLMLREGFDVNNICVIVPLRSSEAPILLEQIMGRGLRLMWREPEYKEIKDENRMRLLKNKEQPSNYLDILSIVEHPAFLQFYDELIKDGLAGEDSKLPGDGGSIFGDMIKVGLKDGYEKYNLYWPFIIREKEELLKDTQPLLDNMKPMEWYDLDKLLRMVSKGGEEFYSEEMTVKTRFGDYKVTADLFTAQSYNDFLAKLVYVITNTLVRVTQRTFKEYPVLQVNQVLLVEAIDTFIRHKLFTREFDPLSGENWRVLMLSKTGITEHLVRELSKVIYKLQKNVDIEEAEITKLYFSQVKELKMRENYALDVAKSIYPKMPYPSNKGGFEKAFIEAANNDSRVLAFIKILEYAYEFAHVNYIRSDGILSRHFPDFIVKTESDIYLVETKAQMSGRDQNVLQKERGALDWVKTVNQLSESDRDGRIWWYVVLTENTFYRLHGNGASIPEILELSKLTRENVNSSLF